MEENKELEVIENSIVQRAESVALQTNSPHLLPNIDLISKFAESIKDSTLGKNFAKLVDGKETIDTMDIVSNIAIGYEVGFQPMTALTFGKRLNQNTLISILKGRAMGIDPITAMDKIGIIPKKKGDGVSIAVDVSIINKCLADALVKIEILEDYQPVYNYYKNGKVDDKIDEEEVLIDGVVSDKFFIIKSSTTKEEVASAKTDNKILLTRSEYTKRTKIRFSREITKTVITISYTLQLATNAELFRGTVEANVVTGAYVTEGKDNWNKYPDVMLRNRTLSIGGRIIAGDKLQGVYEYESEVKDIF